jgi:uncharacterized protein (DUF2237 family)
VAPAQLAFITMAIMVTSIEMEASTRLDEQCSHVMGLGAIICLHKCHIVLVRPDNGWAICCNHWQHQLATSFVSVPDICLTATLYKVLEIIARLMEIVLADLGCLPV